MINIESKDKCCGCTACASICPKQAIQMEADEEGFLYPNVYQHKCVDCHLCEMVCPIIFRDDLEVNSKPLKYLAARLNNFSELMASSSGGVFWALAKEIVARKGIVVGAEYSKDVSVIHGFAENIEDCKKFRGSKYSQSDITGCFKKIKFFLESGRTVLFSGNPCQVEGLKRYLNKTYENLMTVDLVCHAVPSPKFFREYCDYVNLVFKKELVAINMRDKADHGWSHKYSYRYIFADGTEEVDSTKISNWGRLFFSQYINRPSCHSCRFSNLQRPGDITLADFWDDEHNRRDVVDKYGTSLVLINTEKGSKLFDAVRSSLNVFEVSERDSLQPSLVRRTPSKLDRAQFWAYYQRKGFLKTYKKYFSDSIFAKMKKFIPLNIKVKIKKCFGGKCPKFNIF